MADAAGDTSHDGAAPYLGLTRTKRRICTISGKAALGSLADSFLIWCSAAGRSHAPPSITDGSRLATFEPPTFTILGRLLHYRMVIFLDSP